MEFWVYKLIHQVGLAGLFLSFGGLIAHAMNGGTRDNNRARGLLAATHGISLLLILVAGFGMLAKSGMISDFPGWVIAKIAIWLVMGALIVVPKRMPGAAKALWFVIPLIVAVASFLVLRKPF